MPSACWVLGAEFRLMGCPKRLVKVRNEAKVWSKKVSNSKERKGLMLESCKVTVGCFRVEFKLMEYRKSLVKVRNEAYVRSRKANHCKRTEKKGLLLELCQVLVGCFWGRI